MFNGKTDLQPTLQILKYQQQLEGTDKRQVTISDGTHRTAYCCNTWNNALFDETIVQYAIIEIKRYVIFDSILVILEFAVSNHQSYRIVGDPQRLPVRSLSVAPAVDPVTQAAAPIEYLPIKDITKTQCKMIYGKVEVNKRENRTFVDQYIQASKVLNFKVTDSSGCISVCAYSKVLDKFIAEIEVLNSFESIFLITEGSLDEN